MNITIINTGGTFNKRYNPLTGNLDVPSNSIALDKIISSCHNINFEIKNIVSKDSLDMNDEDRALICKEVEESKNEKIIIIHGTDTIDLTSKYLEENISNKQIVFTGAMVPMSIDEVEATMNFSLALGFLNVNLTNGVYISMHGVVKNCSNLVKNRELGQFLEKN